MALNELNTRQLTYNKEDRSFVGEISDFGKSFTFISIFPDACDVGIYLVSQHTGQTVRYYVNRVIRNFSEEITAWELHPVPCDNKHDLGPVIIYND